MVFAVIAWFFSLLVYLMVFYSLKFTSITLLDLAAVYSISSTVETLTAGFPVGAVEITMINLYALYGVPVAIAAAATTLTRLITFWCQVLIGYPLINFMGIEGLGLPKRPRGKPKSVVFIRSTVSSACSSFTHCRYFSPDSFASRWLPL